MCVVAVGVSGQTLPAPRRLRTEFQPPDEMALSVPTDGLRLSWQVSEQPHLCVAFDRDTLGRSMQHP
jgi:arylamine N-acetyltransferase